MRQKVFLLLAVTIGLLGICLRLYKLNQIPAGLYWDEVAILVDVKTIVATGKDMHGGSFWQPIYPSYGDYKAPGLPITASIVANIFGVSGWSLRLVSVLAWILTTGFGVGCIWLLAKKWPDRDRQVVSLSFLVISSILPWSFFFSRIAFESFLSQAFVVMSIFFLLLTTQFANRRWTTFFFLLLAILCGTAAGYAYFAARYIWPALVVLIGVYNFFLQKKIELIKYIFVLSTYFLLLLPSTQSPLYKASQVFRLSTSSLIGEEARLESVLAANEMQEMAGKNVLNKMLFHRDILRFTEFTENVGEHLSPVYLFITGDTNVRHGTGGHGLLFLTFLPLFLIGLYLLWRKDLKLLLLLLGWYLLSLVPASLAADTPHAMRTLSGLFALLVIATFGLAGMIVYFFRKQPHRWKQIIVGIWVVLASFDIFSYYYFYFGAYTASSSQAWQAEYPQVVAAVQKHRLLDERVSISFPDGRLYLWFLASDAYEAKEIQSFAYHDFQLQEFDNLKFETSTESTLEQNSLFLLAKQQVSTLLSTERFEVLESLQVDGQMYMLIRRNK